MDKLIDELSDKIAKSLALKTTYTKKTIQPIVQTTLQKFNIMPQADFDQHKNQLTALINKITALESKTK